MSKFIFILGFAGSGNSHLAEEMKSKDKNLVVIDDAFHPQHNPENYKIGLNRLKQAVAKNYDAVIIEGAYCWKEFRDRETKVLRSIFPSVDFEWICFEKDITKANKNLDRLDRKDRDPEGHKKINEDRLNPNYTYPDNCKIIAIFDDDTIE